MSYNPTTGKVQVVQDFACPCDPGLTEVDVTVSGLSVCCAAGNIGTPSTPIYVSSRFEPTTDVNNYLNDTRTLPEGASPCKWSLTEDVTSLNLTIESYNGTVCSGASGQTLDLIQFRHEYEVVLDGTDYKGVYTIRAAYDAGPPGSPIAVYLPGRVNQWIGDVVGDDCLPSMTEVLSCGSITPPGETNEPWADGGSVSLA